MNINTQNMISITDANRNFSQAAKMVDEKGSVIIMKNNKPRYVLLCFDALQSQEASDTEEVMAISRRLIKKNMKAYEILAK
jgi:antitoxin Phd